MRMIGHMTPEKLSGTFSCYGHADHCLSSGIDGATGPRTTEARHSGVCTAASYDGGLRRGSARLDQEGLATRHVLDLIETLSPGDRFMVSELSRLGRRLGQILQIVDHLVQKGVGLVAIKEAIRLEGKQTLQTKAMLTLFGLFAEIERDLIAERTKEGLIAAKAKGKRLGGPRGP